MEEKKLNFGCGKDIREGWINVDRQKGKGVDCSFDFNEFPYPFENNTFDYILLKNVLDHLQDCRKVLDELWRISKPLAKIKIIVPYYNCRSAYNDFNLKHFFNKKAMIQLVMPEKSTWRMDTQRIKRFEVQKLELIPNRVGKLIPKRVRETISWFIPNLIVSIVVELLVRKYQGRG